jgi:hypothetical protein
MYHVDQINISFGYSKIKEQISMAMPDNPACYGWSSFSQCDEDGIIRECLRRIGKNSSLSKSFIEVGCSDGLENNSHQLLLDGFSGVWIEGDNSKVDFLKKQLGGLKFKNLLIEHAFVHCDNFVPVILKSVDFLGGNELDFFSLDIDGNDFYLAPHLLKICKPKLLCVEYNAKFPPPSKLVMSYNITHTWTGDDYYGASLQAWVDSLEGYTLVCCNLSGVNAFFVRDEFAPLFTSFDTDALYQPPRYWLANGSLGHNNSLKWLKQTIDP